MKAIKESELVINKDGSVYHLNVKPEDIATDILFVGDQDRVNEITKHFETIEFSTQKREFKTTTGSYKGKRLSVISTGIGPDNIDIVWNELDALVNIDFKTRQQKDTFTSLRVVRVGTSGALQEEIPVDAFVLSQMALGTDNMMRSYVFDSKNNSCLEEQFVAHMNWDLDKGKPYGFDAAEELVTAFMSEQMHAGITITAPGFYGAQGRVLRLPLSDATMQEKWQKFSFQQLKATNLEMETAAIYGLSRLLGHQALSLNAIVANRAKGTFSANAQDTIDRLIVYTLDRFLKI